ncbi:MAG: MarR family winged helix-turn-helix transcriptional regulator [Spirochaeta sp.]|jgi:DNA-binding MarR family transcriptional regulator|nr:MarR family winged helix-turn-helix transcriptional regulator [Spirochaeta sp.]
MFAHAVDKKRKERFSPEDFEEIRDECVGSNIGRAARIVGRIYEDAFRDVGISSPQFGLLVALQIDPGSSAGDLAEILGSDPSTVSRNTELLVKRGLIRVEPGEDRRVRTYFLTDAGDQTIQSCVPRWKSAQRTALKQIGRASWRDIRKSLRRLHT